MNPQTIKLIAALFSMKQEIRLIFFTLGVICLLPVFAVLILTQAGLDIISGALVFPNPQTAQVDIKDPATGEIIDHVDQVATWPIQGPVTLEFGKRSPYQLFHTGIDIADPNREIGDPVVAFMKGKVTEVGVTSWGFGKYVKVNHGHFVTSIYAHLDCINVSEGQDVDPTVIVGTRGSTGWSTGPHLHFQINVFGIPVNPRVFLTGEP